MGFELSMMKRWMGRKSPEGVAGMMKEMMPMMMEKMGPDGMANMMPDMMATMMPMMGKMGPDKMANMMLDMMEGFFDTMKPEDMERMMHDTMPKMMDHCFSKMDDTPRPRVLSMCRESLDRMEENPWGLVAHRPNSRIGRPYVLLKNRGGLNSEPASVWQLPIGSEKKISLVWLLPFPMNAVAGFAPPFAARTGRTRAERWL